MEIAKDFIHDSHKNLLEQPESLQAEWLNKKKIVPETITRFKIGMDGDCLVLPCGIGFIKYAINEGDGGGEAVVGEECYGSGLLFNTDALYNADDKPVFVVDDIFDALALEQAGGTAVALLKGNKDSLLSQLKQKPSSNLLLVVLKNETGDTEREKSIKRELEGIETVRLWNDKDDEELPLLADLIKPGEKLLDVDAAMLAERINQIESNIAQYANQYRMKNCTVGVATDILGNLDAEVLSTGFGLLDKSLDGGFRPGLYILGGESSSGKTTMVHQMADTIASQGVDVIFVSLEMSASELVAKSVCRQAYVDGNAKISYWDIADRKRYEALDEADKTSLCAAREAYKKFGTNMFIKEGMGNIGASGVRSFVVEHIKKTGKTPIIIVDYLQILMPEEAGYSDRHNIDQAIVELKRMSRDFCTPVIVISSFNRMGYDKDVSMESFKESGAIEYTADVLMGIKKYIAKTENSKDKDIIEDEKNAYHRKVMLRILKNRSGEAGTDILYEYYTKNHFFKEKEVI